MGRHRRTPDYFARRAKREGKPARSVYKLEEIDQRWHILRRGIRVLDLGCAPGSWMLYAAERVGPAGRVVGFDLTPLAVPLPPQAHAQVGDVFELSAAAASELEGPFDVVLSDMAPATMGDHKTDAIRSAALAEAALQIAAGQLVAGGAVVVKLLEGGEVVDIVKAMRLAYAKVERLRPKATRKASTEVFLIGLGKRAPTRNTSPEVGGAGDNR